MCQPSGTPWLEGVLEKGLWHSPVGCSEVYHRWYFHVPRCLHTQQGPAITALHVFHWLEAVALLERNICLVLGKWETKLVWSMKSVRNRYTVYHGLPISSLRIVWNLWEVAMAPGQTCGPTSPQIIHILILFDHPYHPDTHTRNQCDGFGMNSAMEAVSITGKALWCCGEVPKNIAFLQRHGNHLQYCHKNYCHANFLHSFLPLKDHERSQAMNFPTFVHWFTSCSFAK